MILIPEQFYVSESRDGLAVTWLETPKIIFWWLMSTRVMDVTNPDLTLKMSQNSSPYLVCVRMGMCACVHVLACSFFSCFCIMLKDLKVNLEQKSEGCHGQGRLVGVEGRLKLLLLFPVWDSCPEMTRDLTQKTQKFSWRLCVTTRESSWRSHWLESQFVNWAHWLEHIRVRISCDKCHKKLAKAGHFRGHLSQICQSTEKGQLVSWLLAQIGHSKKPRREICLMLSTWHTAVKTKPQASATFQLCLETSFPFPVARRNGNFTSNALATPLSCHMHGHPICNCSSGAIWKPLFSVLLAGLFTKLVLCQ